MAARTFRVTSGALLGRRRLVTDVAFKNGHTSEAPWAATSQLADYIDIGYESSSLECIPFKFLKLHCHCN
jgi:hypothetical protein